MMGTDKKPISSADLPPAFEEVAQEINNNNAKDKEEKFLQVAALVHNYRQCGIMAAQKEIMAPSAEQEEKKYCSNDAHLVLVDILGEESNGLLKLWLQNCYEKQQIILPEIVPQLLQTGVQQKRLQPLITACCGKRGQWISSFNAAWNFSSMQTDEELWQTGTLEQRKETLKYIRKNDASKSREWLQETWAQEDANTRAGFLEIFSDNLSADDIPFLESLSEDKSKKVKDEATRLLKQIPGSSIVQLYEQILSQSVVLKKEKGLLGMRSKMVLQFKLPALIDESVYKTGIDKLSNSKEFTDDEFVIF